MIDFDLEKLIEEGEAAYQKEIQKREDAITESRDNYHEQDEYIDHLGKYIRECDSNLDNLDDDVCKVFAGAQQAFKAVEFLYPNSYPIGRIVLAGKEKELKEFFIDRVEGVYQERVRILSKFIDMIGTGLSAEEEAQKIKSLKEKYDEAMAKVDSLDNKAICRVYREAPKFVKIILERRYNKIQSKINQIVDENQDLATALKLCKDGGAEAKLQTLKQDYKTFADQLQSNLETWREKEAFYGESKKQLLINKNESIRLREKAEDDLDSKYTNDIHAAVKQKEYLESYHRGFVADYVADALYKEIENSDLKQTKKELAQYFMNCSESEKDSDRRRLIEDIYSKVSVKMRKNIVENEKEQ